MQNDVSREMTPVNPLHGVAREIADYGRAMGRQEGRVEVAQYALRACPSIPTDEFKDLCAWIGRRNSEDAGITSAEAEETMLESALEDRREVVTDGS